MSHVFLGIYLKASLNIAKWLIFISESQRVIKKSFQFVTKIKSTRKVQPLKSLMKLSIDKKKSSQRGNHKAADFHKGCIHEKNVNSVYDK